VRKIKILFLFLACSFPALAQQSSDNATQTKPSRHLTIRVSGELLAGKVDHLELPKYPEAALQARIHGNVILEVMVDTSGKVILVTPVDGDPLLIAASVDALRDFHFRPTVLNGTSLRVDSAVEFEFSIHGHRLFGGQRCFSPVASEDFW
jgi:TonB family protein